jgi:endonuclease-3
VGHLAVKRSSSLRHIPELEPTAGECRRICRTLERAYHSPRHGNPDNPLDDLIYIILSTRTRDSSFARTFRAVKQAFPSWNGLFSKDRRKLERILIPGGLGRLKSGQVTTIVAELRRQFGTASLAPLKKMNDREAESFLTALPGVGPKIAKCVLMYTLKRRVLPVDVHVHRVATRLGFETKKRPDTSQELIESAVPPELRYSFHVNAISLGRSVCLARNPKCDICPISKWCRFHRREQGLER